MKNKKRIKQVLGILSILPTFTGQTEAKPITPRQNTEKKMLKAETTPCPMTKDPKQESNTPGITNTQMGLLLLGMLVLPVTGIKASEKGYELIISGFERMKNGISKRSKKDKKTEPISTTQNSDTIREKKNSSPISEIQKDVENILGVTNLPGGVRVTSNKTGIKKLEEVEINGHVTYKIDLATKTNKDLKEISDATERLAKMMYGDDYDNPPPENTIELSTYKTEDGNTRLLLSMWNCKKNKEELGDRLRNEKGADVSYCESVEPCDEGKMNIGITTENNWTTMYLTLPSANKEEKPENPVENQEIDENAIATG